MAGSCVSSAGAAKSCVSSGRSQKQATLLIACAAAAVAALKVQFEAVPRRAVVESFVQVARGSRVPGRGGLFPATGSPEPASPVAGAVPVAPLSLVVVAALAWQALPVRRDSRSRQSRRVAMAATEDSGMSTMITVPPEGVPEEDKVEVPRVVYEGSEEVTSLKGVRPSGSSTDPNQTYFWKMAQDKRTIDVIVPVEDWVEGQDVIFRLGEDAMEPNRGPTLELGYRKKNEEGRYKEHLMIDGQILNAINQADSFWILDDMAGVKIILLTLARPSMLRFRHDPVLRRKTQEERIEPQTWDALLVEERIKPEITKKIFFDISLSGKSAGRIEFGLYGDVLPKTVNNFIGLCTGQYVDDEGNTQQSAHCYKNTSFGSVMPGFLMAAGNPGLDHAAVEFSPDELAEYTDFFEDFSSKPRDVGQVKKHWTIRWGADIGLGNGEDASGFLRKEGQAVDGNSDVELREIAAKLRSLVEKGEGAKVIFYREEWGKGCDMTGGTFPAERFLIPHSKRGMLSMDRNEDKDVQGSNFFITLKEFPQMDQRWVCFGEVVSGWDVLDAIETDYEFSAKEAVIEDCGELEIA